MIVNNKAQPLISNSEPAKAMNFGISDVRLVVDLLSKLYAHPIRTLVQEYICNGRDAMRENGTWGKTPIDISVPNALEPTFKVRDYGCGISPDRMENVFVNYGSSTKRNTNTQTGGFGIGAKSAFSYTDSFTITSFVNGIKYIYVAHLGDSGGVNLIEQTKTTEPNGVEISIGVKSKDVAEFRNAVQRCVRYWSEPINFFGVTQGDIVQVKPFAVLDNMTVYPADDQGNSDTFYLIDGIEYPQVNDNYYSIISLQSFSYRVAIVLPNGFFKVASSRERLENNEDNKNKEAKVLSDCKLKINKLINNTFKNPSISLQDKLKTLSEYKGFSQVRDSNIEVGTDFYIHKGVVGSHKENFEIRIARKNRVGNLVFEGISKHHFTIDKAVIIDASTDKELNTLPRRLNHYLSTNTKQELVVVKDMKPMLFVTDLGIKVIDSNTLPKPAVVKTNVKPKVASDSYVYRYRGSMSSRMEFISSFNMQSYPVVVVDSFDEEGIDDMWRFLSVYRIPKANRAMVTRKIMTMDEAKVYLLKEHSKHAIGLVGTKASKVKAIKDLGEAKIESDLQEYLFKLDPKLKDQQDKIEARYKKLRTKYPLLDVVDELHGKSLQIVIDELNKQMKEEK